MLKSCLSNLCSLLFANAAILCSLTACSKDDSPLPSDGDAQPASELSDTVAMRDEAIDLLLADGKNLALTGKAYNVKATTASIPVRFNASAEHLKSAQLVLLLTDNSSKNIEFGKGCTEVYIKSDWLDDKGISVVYVTNLIPSSAYRYRLFYRYNSYEQALGDVETLQTDDPTELNADAVDLGLSVKWASWNLGASRSYQPGRFFLFAQPGSWASYSKAASVSGSDADPAALELGNGWQSPTTKQCLELINKCTWVPGSENGNPGFLVNGVGDFYGNYIFIPAAGYVNASATRVGDGSGVMLWSGDISDSPDKAYAIQSNSDATFSVARVGTSCHLPIRPVFIKKCHRVRGKIGNAPPMASSAFWLNFA